MPAFDLNSPPPGAFVYRTESHYDDLDGQMVLHHPRYLVFVERAQQAWFEAVLDAPRFDWRSFPDMYHVVRRLEIDYLASIAGVVPFAVVLWCEQVRAAAMTTGFQLRSVDGDTIYAHGRRVNCRIAREDHRPQMWSELFQERFAREVEKAAAADLGKARR